MPWKATPMKSIAAPTPGPTEWAASPATSMWWSAGLGFSIEASTGRSRAQLTATPSRANAAAAARLREVTKWSAPRSSSAPQRPQFVVASKVRCIHSRVTGWSMAGVPPGSNARTYLPRTPVGRATRIAYLDHRGRFDVDEDGGMEDAHHAEKRRRRPAVGLGQPSQARGRRFHEAVDVGRVVGRYGGPLGVSGFAPTGPLPGRGP